MTCIRCSLNSNQGSQTKINDKINRPRAWITCRSKIPTNVEYVIKSHDNEALDLVLEVLWYTGINFRVSKVKLACENVLRNIVSVVYIIGVVYSFGIRIHAFISYNSGTMIITELLAFLCSACLWISINAKKDKIVNLKDSVHDVQNKTEKYGICLGKKSYLIKCLCFITIMFPIFSGAISMLISKIKLESIDSYLSFLTFGFTPNVGFYYKYILLFLLRSYDLTICFVSPQISCLLFSVLCHNVSCYIKESKTQFRSDAHRGNLSAAIFIKKYKKVKKLIRELEKAISIPMFFAMAFLLCELFALMSNSVSIVRHKSSLASLVIVLCALSTTSFYVIFIIFRASNVEEMHKSLVRAFIELPEEPVQYTSELLNILKLVAFQDTLQITAWGMFPIKRGFFLTIVGTLATYGVLLVQFT